jgi:hypothetical protein
MSTLAVNAVTDANGGNTATINSMTPTADSLQGFRNRIINGDMRIDQRNAGASVTLTNTAPYVTDRWKCNNNTDGTATCQQVSDAPTGFNYSLKYTATATDTSLTTTQSTWVSQCIEGFNTADLLWGTANAKTITVSFWVKSSLTGNFSFSIQNNAFNRSYVTTYAINSADTWEYKTITIVGDTSGTWLTTNGLGVQVGWYLGVGPDLTTGTVNAWQGAGRQSASGSVSVIGTLNATWFITGVQLEVGSVATPFERRPYGTELALCQRYFYMLCNGASQTIPTGSYYSTNLVATTVQLPIEMRTSPSIYQVSGTDYFGIYTNNARDDFDAFTSLVRASSRCVALDASGGGVSGTIGHSGPIQTIDAAARLGFSAEL